jgi:hypothetical protein
MPLSFLANLGSGIAKLGSAFGRGAVGVGKGIGRGFKRLGELGEEDSSPEPYQTPPFIPREESGRGRSMMEIVAPSDRRLTGGADPYAPRPGMRSLEDAVAAAENDARADSLIERRNLPIPMPDPPGGPPALTPAPSLNELRTALPSLPSGPSPPLAAPPAAPRAVPDMVPDMDLDRRNLPIPALPGHSEGPAPYNRFDAARYDSVMKHAKRDAEGNLTGGFNRDWKSTLKNAFLAASLAARSAGPGEDPLGKALGGALAGGVGSAINPQAGYEFAFDVGERPKMEAEMAREQAARDRANMEIRRQAELDDLRATTGGRRAQADESRANIEFRRNDQELKRLKDESEAKLRNVEMLVKLTGEVKEEDIFNPQTNQIERVRFYPGGRREVLGLSGPAELARRKDEEEMKRTKYRESADTSREGMRQGGQNLRQQKQLDLEEKLAAGGDGSRLKKPSAEGSQGGQSGQRVTPEQLQRYAEKRKLTPEKARQNLRDMGYTVD